MMIIFYIFERFFLEAWHFEIDLLYHVYQNNLQKESMETS